MYQALFFFPPEQKKQKKKEKRKKRRLIAGYINAKEFTLVLKTRLRQERISYDESDVRLEGWRACQEMENNLLRTWQSTNIAELLVFRESKTGEERTLVMKDFETRMKSLGESIKGLLKRFGLITSSEASVTSPSVTSAVTSTSDTSVTELGNAGAQMIGSGVSGLANAGAELISTSVAGLANIGANVVGTGLWAIGPTLSNSESPAEAGTNSSPGGYELNLDTD